MLLGDIHWMRMKRGVSDRGDVELPSSAQPTDCCNSPGLVRVGPQGMILKPLIQIAILGATVLCEIVGVDSSNAWAAKNEVQYLGNHPPDPARYKQEGRVLEAVKSLFLSHIDKASNVSIPYVPLEFPWRIDWDKQQAYCRGIWNALTTEKKQRLRFLGEPTSSVHRDGEQAFGKAWRGMKFQKGCWDEAPFYHATHVTFEPHRGRRLYDHSPDWIIELVLPFDSLEKNMYFLAGSSLLYARPTETEFGCGTTQLGDAHVDDLGVPYDRGGIEDIYILVDDKPLLVKFGMYVPEMDQSGMESKAYIPGHNEFEASYFAWFGKRRGRIGQGFVAVESHQMNLYRTLALEKNGYQKGPFGEEVALDDEDKSLAVLDYADKVDYQRYVCVINFDLHGKK